MSVKLSELLEHALAVLCSVDVAFPTSGMPIPVNIFRQRAELLRAIASALVELVAADDACALIDADCECDDAYDVVDAANRRLVTASKALREAMKEAGVTCD